MNLANYLCLEHTGRFQTTQYHDHKMNDSKIKHLQSHERVLNEF